MSICMPGGIHFGVGRFCLYDNSTNYWDTDHVLLCHMFWVDEHKNDYLEVHDLTEYINLIVWSAVAPPTSSPLMWLSGLLQRYRCQMDVNGRFTYYLTRNLLPIGPDQTSSPHNNQICK